MLEWARGEAFRPDPRYDDPAILSRTLIERILPLVSRPGRYIGGELGAVRDEWRADRANLVLSFPDAYEVGMSHQGLRILYHLLNERDDTFCDLSYAPWPDMEALLRREGMPVFALESRRSLRSFDVIGFSLGYELAYTNLLNMLDLAGIPLLAAERGPGDPLVVAGGHCTMNPAVVGPFCDAVMLGDGEEAVLDLARIVAVAKSGADGSAAGANRRPDRDDLLEHLHALPGVWYPAVTAPVAVRVVADLNSFAPPAELVPMIEPVHDRLALEVMRGCARGCRFCQAGMINRPVRERDVDSLVEAARSGVAHSGYSEVNLLSLSTSDYSELAGAVAGIQDSLADSRTNLVLPSLRVDSAPADLYERISRERPASFTFAPEAGSQRLRDVINKQISDEDIVQTAVRAFASGVKHVKLYFMIGLPTETDEDLDDLVALVGRVVAVAPRGGKQVHVSISPFSPKAHTPFQWAGQISRGEIVRRNSYLAGRLRRLQVKVGLREAEVSFLEAVLGLGDEEVAGAVLRAWQLGARFDGWTEYFDYGRWEQAFADCRVDPERYTAPRTVTAALPWDTVAAAVGRDFLAADWARAQRARTLADCRMSRACFDCDACGEDPEHVFARPAAELSPLPEAPQAGCDPRNLSPDGSGTELRKWTVWRQQAAAKCWYRVEFAKTGEMVFLGHLDFQRQLQLALRRSGLPTAYSKGYHPHPLLKFGPPLPVGVGGERESLDLALCHAIDDCAARLNSVLPAGILIRRVAVVGANAPRSIDQSVERFEYRITLPSNEEGGLSEDQAAAAVEAFLASKSWPFLRRRPGKDNIEIEVRSLVPPGGLTMETTDTNTTNGAYGPRLTLSLLRVEDGAGLPVHDLLACLFGEELVEPHHCLITRTGYFGRDRSGRWQTPLEEVGETSRRFWLMRHINA